MYARPRVWVRVLICSNLMRERPACTNSSPVYSTVRRTVRTRRPCVYRAMGVAMAGVLDARESERESRENSRWSLVISHAKTVDEFAVLVKNSPLLLHRSVPLIHNEVARANRAELNQPGVSPRKPRIPHIYERQSPEFPQPTRARYLLRKLCV